MAMESCEGRKVLTKDAVDRLSDLPDEVVLHILSFLCLRDLVRFGSSSKRCTELFLSTPILEIEEYSGRHHERSRIFSYFDRFFMLRGDNKIQRFSIDIWTPDWEDECIDDREEFTIFTWIKNAVRRKVEVLELEIHPYALSEERPIMIPSCVFSCGSLRSLMVNIRYTTLRAPSLAFSSNLEKLNLCDVTIDEGFFKWISLSCKCIKTLNLESVCVSGNITIESSSLESLSISDEVDKIKPCDLIISGEKLEAIEIWCSVSSLSIDAPNLYYLKWHGTVTNHQLGKQLCVQNAEISLDLHVDGFDKVYDVLCSIRKVKTLAIDRSAILALSRVKEGYIPAPLDGSFSCLHIKICSSLDDHNGLVSLFRIMPNLSTLRLKYYTLPSKRDDSFEFDREFWKSQNLGLISRLKYATIDLSKVGNGSSVIEFIRFILECAQNLKSMLVILPSQMGATHIENLDRSRMTSNARVRIRKQ